MTDAAADQVMGALDELEQALEESSALHQEALSRVQRIRGRRRDGRPYSDIVRTEPRPRIVELVSRSLERLRSAGSRFRRTEAQALRSEGMKTEEIASLYGVTRQRVSRLTRPER
ncbi:MAG TPA: hypothetical protein VFA11_12580 [Acidimicrobiales bacterium]|nr:hypothetical protein [Acidimicrobiales bacterium]